MNNAIYEQFKINFDYLAEKVVASRADGPLGLLVQLDDGRWFCYNGYDHTCRLLPSDPDNMTEDDFRIEFGNRLRAIMQSKRISQYDLARMTGMPQGRISKYVNGKYTPTFYTVDKIAKALECSMDELRFY